MPLAPLRDADLVVAALADRLARRLLTPRPSRHVSATAARTPSSTTSSTSSPTPRVRSPRWPLRHRHYACSSQAARPSAFRASTSSTCHRSPMTRESSSSASVLGPYAPMFAASAAVRELCVRLDQLPLALELAAARTKLLSPEALLERLGDRLDLLKGARDVDERHATLRATIAWSHDLLDADEQRLFRRMSVFRGGCTLETAEQVCDADLDTLASLLDKSLLRRRTGRLGEERFWMLETIREFAAERLEESPDATVIQRATPSGCSRSRARPT